MNGLDGQRHRASILRFAIPSARRLGHSFGTKSMTMTDIIFPHQQVPSHDSSFSKCPFSEKAQRPSARDLAKDRCATMVPELSMQHNMTASHFPLRHRAIALCLMAAPVLRGLESKPKLNGRTVKLASISEESESSASMSVQCCERWPWPKSPRWSITRIEADGKLSLKESCPRLNCSISKTGCNRATMFLL